MTVTITYPFGKVCIDKTHKGSINLSSGDNSIRIDLDDLTWQRLRLRKYLKCMKYILYISLLAFTLPLTIAFCIYAMVETISYIFLLLGNDYITRFFLIGEKTIVLTVLVVDLVWYTIIGIITVYHGRKDYLNGYSITYKMDRKAFIIIPIRCCTIFLYKGNSFIDVIDVYVFSNDTYTLDLLIWR